jgi:hypothetical protein
MDNFVNPLPFRACGGIAPGVSADQWMPTALAARALGVSARTLKRYGADFLEPGRHWCRGAYSNSPTRWDVEACRTEIHRRGMRTIREARPADRLQAAVINERTKGEQERFDN